MKAGYECERHKKSDPKAHYAQSPVRGWMTRSERFRAATNPTNALQSFAALRREIEPFSEVVFSAANAL
jgi:hypothetical protein